MLHGQTGGCTPRGVGETYNRTEECGKQVFSEVTFLKKGIRFSRVKVDMTWFGLALGERCRGGGGGSGSSDSKPTTSMSMATHRYRHTYSYIWD